MTNETNDDDDADDDDYDIVMNVKLVLLDLILYVIAFKFVYFISD